MTSRSRTDDARTETMAPVRNLALNALLERIAPIV